jgi:carboxypeptidase Taq
MVMEEQLIQLKSILGEIYDLNAAKSLLGWDHQTYMPKGGVKDRSEQIATLARLAHQKSTSGELGSLLEKLDNYSKQLDPDSDDACLLTQVKRIFDKENRIPTSWITEFSRITTLGQSAWENSKRKSDFSIFLPHLQEIILRRQEYASFFQPYQHIYDPQLDDFEPGMTTIDVQEIFYPLRETQVDIIQRIAESFQVENKFLHQSFDENNQWKFGVDVITALGFDWERGRQDRSVHPFTSGFGLGDTRITTRLDPDNLNTGLFGTLHECGHALYEQGIDPAIRRSPLAAGASSAVHESQSRLWENIVGRSLPFWQYFYPKLQHKFQSQLANINLATFYKGINIVKPSNIRIQADEATYNLHIMLRVDLEIALLEGSLAVKDLPDAWNAKMKSYLGVVPPDDASGVLQDVHWSSGLIGYFPTYALGNLVASQLWEKMEEDIPTIYEDISRGTFISILEWLRQNIHRHGSKYLPTELIRRVTGTGINSKSYLHYLKKKYGEIYDVEFN